MCYQSIHLIWVLPIAVNEISIFALNGNFTSRCEVSSAFDTVSWAMLFIFNSPKNKKYERTKLVTTVE